MARCERLGIPALAFVNGLDREHADFEAAVASLGELGLKTVALTLPIGAESGFRGVTLLRMKALLPPAKPRSRPSSPARRAMRASSWSRPSPNATTRCSRNTSKRERWRTTRSCGAGRRHALAQHRAAAVRLGAQQHGVAALLWAASELLPSAADRGA